MYIEKGDREMGATRVKDIGSTTQFTVRDRLLAVGARGLSTVELVACLMGEDEAATAPWFAQIAGSHVSGLRHLDTAEVLGQLSPSRTAKLIAAVELGHRTWAGSLGAMSDLSNPELVARELGCIAYAEQEHFAVLLLDIKNRLISKQIVSRGTLDETIAHPRDVFRAAVRHNAANIIVAHNHPSGNTDPSQEDLRLTQILIDCGKTLQIPVLDHVIVGQGNFTSLRRVTGLWGSY
jgi:DNA repair protein RadC